jgi:seryl-tRNA synthetase
VHQFDKVEMFVFCEPEDAREEHESCWRSRRAPEALEITGGEHRRRRLRRLGGKKYDWGRQLPGQQRRELTSYPNTTDFQARRLDIRYRPEAGARATSPP